MSQIILYYKGAYNVYCTISDAPLFDSAVSLYELEAHIHKYLGQCGVDGLAPRLERAHRKGSSDLLHSTLEETLCVNRAGPNEEYLPLREFIDTFLNPNDV